jgi:hypothetical protein
MRVQGLRRLFHTARGQARTSDCNNPPMELRVEAASNHTGATRCARADDLRTGADELLALADAQQRRADELRRTARLLLEQAHDLDANAGRTSQIGLGIQPA